MESELYFFIFNELVEAGASGAFLYFCIFSSKMRFVSGVVIWSQMLFAAIAGGRREVLFFFSLYLLVRHLMGNGLSFRTIVKLAAFGFIFIYVITPIFLNARNHLGTYSENDAAIVSTGLVISGAAKSLFSGSASSTNALKENLAQRSDANEFLGAVVSRELAGRSYLDGGA